MLEVALTRFGCCPAEDSHVLTRQLLRTGVATTPAGHAIRIVAFGDAHDQCGRRRPWLIVPMGHVVEYLQDYLRQHWPQLRSSRFKEPAYGVLALMEKWRVATPPAVGPPTSRGGDGDAMSVRGDA